MDLFEIAEQVKALLRDRAIERARMRNTTFARAVSSLFYPYIAGRGEAQGFSDKRKRRWAISCSVLEVRGDFIEAERIMTAGRTIERGGGDYGEVDIVTGLDGAAALIRDALEGEGFARDMFGDLVRAFNQLRSTISRNGGRATMRRRDESRRYVLTVDVFREDAIPAPAPKRPSPRAFAPAGEDKSTAR